MLQNLRHHAGGLFAKILLGLIIASFALVGVGDMFHRYTTKPVAVVAGTSIQKEEYDHRLKLVKDQIMASTKGKAKMDDLKIMGIPQKILDDMINKQLENHEMTALDIQVSDGTLDRFVKSMPELQNKKGQFEKDRLSHLSKAQKHEFLMNMRTELKKQQLFGALAGGIQLPKAYEEDLYKAIHQEVVFSVIYVPESAAKVTATPTDADLEQIYKANPDVFSQPEFRDVSVLVIDPKGIQDKVLVSDAQIQEEYERRKEEFSTPETRDVIQLTFSSRESAETAQASLNSGETVNKIVKENKPTVQTHTKAIRDKFPTVQGDQIFALQKPGVTDVIDSALRRESSVFVVDKINPAGEQPLSEVRDRLEADLKTRLSHEAVDELRNKVEDELAGGKSLADVATQFNLEILRIGMTDQSGLTPKDQTAFVGDAVTGMKSLVLENAFSQGEGTDSPVLDLPTSKMIVVRVDAIKAKALPPLVDIRDKVAKYWRDSQQQEKIAEISLSMVKEINEGAPLAQVAKKHGLNVRTLEPVSRAGLQEKQFTDAVVTLPVLQRGFKQSIHKATYAPAKDGFAVIVPTKFVPVDLSSKKETEKLDSFKRSLKAVIRRDFEQDYLRELRSKFEVEINQSVIDSTLNGGESK